MTTACRSLATALSEARFASGFATAELHHAAGHDPGIVWRQPTKSAYRGAKNGQGAERGEANCQDITPPPRPLCIKSAAQRRTGGSRARREKLNGRAVALKPRLWAMASKKWALRHDPGQIGQRYIAEQNVWKHSWHRAAR